MSARVVHFWEILDPRPRFLCGKEPDRFVRHVAPALSVNAKTAGWFARHRTACQNCKRVATARVARGRG